MWFSWGQGPWIPETSTTHGRFPVSGCTHRYLDEPPIWSGRCCRESKGCCSKGRNSEDSGSTGREGRTCTKDIWFEFSCIPTSYMRTFILSFQERLRFLLQTKLISNRCLRKRSPHWRRSANWSMTRTRGSRRNSRHIVLVIDVFLER